MNAERERKRREDAVKVITEALTESALSLHRLTTEAELDDPNEAFEEVIVSLSALQLVIETMLRNELLARDYGVAGMLKYPGLREWFDSADQKKAEARAVVSER